MNAQETNPIGDRQTAAHRGPAYYWAKTIKGKDAQGRETELPGISVRDHCLNVGCVAQALIKTLPDSLRQLLPPDAATLAALHDVGKVSPGFQRKCAVWALRHLKAPDEIEETDHAKVSQWFLQVWLASEARTLRDWLMAVGAHHGQSKGRWIKDNRAGGIEMRGTSGLGDWDNARHALAEELVQFFQAGRRLALGPPASAASVSFFAGLVSVADWIGSDECFFSPVLEEPPLEPETRRNKAARALKAIGLETPVVSAASFPTLFPNLTQPNGLQTAAAELIRTPGLWLVEAPMGCGKTEAALLAAATLLANGDASGLYFALPTQTTSNRIHERLAPVVSLLLRESAMLRLAHGASWLHDDSVLQVCPAANFSAAEQRCENPWAARLWFSSVRRALLAPFGVGTIDQALLGVVAAKHFFVRLFGLAGKVVVLDEVHSYDLYTGTLVDVLIEQLLQLRCTVIVLSATLTRARRDELLNVARRSLNQLSAGASSPQSQTSSPDSDPYPLLTGVTASGTTVPFAPALEASSRKVRIRCDDLPFEAATAECVRRAEEGQVVLWIRDTVSEAQRSFNAVRSTRREGGPPVALLHSRFPWFQRDHLEQLWLRRLGIAGVKRWQRRFARERSDCFPKRKGCVLVATQVVEQSVDIDADFLLTDLAPTDMLLQRLGRLWRHERGARSCAEANAWIHAPDCSGLDDPREIKRRLRGLAPPYAAYVLLRSGKEWRGLAGRGGIRLPEDIRAVLEATYDERFQTSEPPAWSVLREELERKREKLRGKAVSACNAWALPALDDDEGVQTRYAELPTSTLVILRELDTCRRGQVRFVTLAGESATAHEREWSRDAARALHRAHVKVPAWWLDRRADQPSALHPYFRGRWALAVLDGDRLCLHGCGEQDLGLRYVPDRGVWCNAEKTAIPQPDFDVDDDEPCD